MHRSLVSLLRLDFVRLRPNTLTILLCALVCLLSTGCVRRRMTLRTNPPGAQVFIDDQEIGQTPCSTNFVYYGTRKITVIKDGYRTETLYQKFSPPWYQIPPLDFITENLTVQEIRDERIVDVTLVPQEIVTEAKLRERAEGLRLNARQGIFTPLAAPGREPPQAAVTELPGTIGFPGQGLPRMQPQFYPTPPLPDAPPAE